jgi:hypothetical protein
MMVGCGQGEGIGDQAQQWLRRVGALTDDASPFHKSLRRLAHGWSGRSEGALVCYEAAGALRAPWRGAAAVGAVHHSDAVAELQVRRSTYKAMIQPQRKPPFSMRGAEGGRRTVPVRNSFASAASENPR